VGVEVITNYYRAEVYGGQAFAGFMKVSRFAQCIETFLDKDLREIIGLYNEGYWDNERVLLL
jgi:hypothetical protein